MRVIDIVPQKFNWEGHSVECYECWLDRISQNEYRVTFKFKLDGKKREEARLGREKRLWLDFRRLDDCSEAFSPLSIPTQRWHEYAIFGGQSGDTLHTFRLKQPLPKEIELQAVSTRYETPKATRVNSETILRLKL